MFLIDKIRNKENPNKQYWTPKGNLVISINLKGGKNITSASNTFKYFLFNKLEKPMYPSIKIR